MDIDNEKWIVDRWRLAWTEQDWREINRMLHGAGMAVCRFDIFAANEYWALADVAAQHTIDCMEKKQNERRAS